MKEYNHKYAKMLVEKGRTYGPELDETTEQLAGAIDRIELLELRLQQADGMVQAMLNFQREENRRVV